jgi:hypothetical protein
MKIFEKFGVGKKMESFLKVSGLVLKWKFFESFEVGKTMIIFEKFGVGKKMESFFEIFGVGNKMEVFLKVSGLAKNGNILKVSRLAKQ